MPSKHKGNNFENYVCKELSKLLTNGEHIDIFNRSSNSGGRQTVLEQKGIELRNQAGDIGLMNSEGQFFLDIFCLECKHYKDISLWSIFTKNKGSSLYGWWNIHIEKSRSVNRHPILIAKQNNRPTIMGFDKHSGEYLNLVFGDIVPLKCVVHWDDIGSMYMFMFDDFLKLDKGKLQYICEHLGDVIENG